MITNELIERINALAKKKKTSGLSAEEESEQKALREEYLAAFRQNVRNQVEGIKVVDQQGHDVTPEKLKEVQRQKGIHGRHLDDK